MIDKNKCVEFEMFDVALRDSLELQIFLEFIFGRHFGPFWMNGFRDL